MSADPQVSEGVDHVGVANNPATRRLFVLSGGGAPGIDIHVGSLLAAVRGFGAVPTAIIGTSAGAVVGALLSACKGDAYALQQIVAALRDRDFRDDRTAWKLRLNWIDHILNPGPIERLLERLLPEQFADLDIPFRCVACDLMTNSAHYLSGGVPLRAAVRASMSISGVWPEVWLDGRPHSDGGTVDNLPLPGDWRDYDEVWLFVASPPLRYSPAKRNAIFHLLWNMHSRGEDGITDTIRHADVYRGSTKVIVVRPEVGHESNVLRFDHGLMRPAHLEAITQIGNQLRQLGIRTR